MNERRRRKRFPLQCSLEFESDREAFTSATVNISSQGFYCVVDRPVRSGAELRCLVDLMHGHSTLSFPGVSLNCEVVVVRSDELENGYGLACRIKNYSVVRSSSGIRSGTRQRIQ